VEETQERTRQNEGKIAEVDQRAQAAAQAADQKAQGAQSAADRAGQTAQQAQNTAQDAVSRTEALDKASKRLVYEVVLSEDQGNFKFGRKDLPAEAKAKLDEMMQQIKADPKGAFFEIAGYTDSVGDKTYNEKLGLERAEVVKRYLYEQHQIPLHKMNVISYGEENPVAENKTKTGRAQNRRVVIRVLV
jgi:outer membrane protein OmpA-like peptidoglycan-associated protein